jgi:hypothetical protein
MRYTRTPRFDVEGVCLRPAVGRSLTHHQEGPTQAGRKILGSLIPAAAAFYFNLTTTVSWYSTLNLWISESVPTTGRQEPASALALAAGG